MPAHAPYQKAATERGIDVAQVPLTVTADAPWFNLIPQRVDVTGTVASEFGPVRGASVTLDLGSQAATIRTGEDGTFGATVTLPLSSALPGQRALNVQVTPAEAWNAPSSQSRDLYIVNVGNIVLLAALLAYVAGGAVSLRRRMLVRAPQRAESIRPVRELAGSGERGSAADLGPTFAWPLFAGPAQQVMSAYRRAAGFLARRRAVSLRPEWTLRDFSRVVDVRRGGPFDRLTTLAERVLYAAPRSEETVVQQAEDLSARVLREEA
jgi:hypothetical protein